MVALSRLEIMPQRITSAPGFGNQQVDPALRASLPPPACQALRPPACRLSGPPASSLQPPASQGLHPPASGLSGPPASSLPPAWPSAAAPSANSTNPAWLKPGASRPRAKACSAAAADRESSASLGRFNTPPAITGVDITAARTAEAGQKRDSRRSGRRVEKERRGPGVLEVLGAGAAPGHLGQEGRPFPSPGQGANFNSILPVPSMTG